MGGKAIELAVPIQNKDCQKVYDQFVDFVSDKLQISVDNFIPLGSTLKKKTSDYGDIDIALNTNLPELEIFNKLIPYFEYHTKIEGLGVLSFGWIHNKGIAQVDLILTNNINWTTWSFYSPNENLSLFKGLFRNELLMSITNNLPKIILEEYDNTLIKYKKYTYNLKDGLYLSTKDHTGKNNNILKRGKTIYKELITNDPDKFINIIFNGQYKSNDILTFEDSINAFINVYSNNELLFNKILIECMNGLLNKKIEIPLILKKLLLYTFIKKNYINNYSKVNTRKLTKSWHINNNLSSEYNKILELTSYLKPFLYKGIIKVPFKHRLYHIIHLLDISSDLCLYCKTNVKQPVRSNLLEYQPVYCVKHKNIGSRNGMYSKKHTNKSKQKTSLKTKGDKNPRFGIIVKGTETANKISNSKYIIQDNGFTVGENATIKISKTKKENIIDGLNSSQRAGILCNINRRPKMEETGKWLPINKLQSFKIYTRYVYKFTFNTYSKFKLEINPNNLKRGRGNYNLDHKYSIKQGFLNNIPPYIIGSKYNLEMLKESENCIKQDKCSITIDKLYELFYHNLD